MKILIVNSGLDGGGAEQYLIQLASELLDRGHKVLWIYGNPANGGEYINRVKSFLIDQVTNQICKDFEAKYTMVEEVINRESPDIIYFHQVYNYNLIDRLTAKKPSVRFVHDLKLMCPDGDKTLKTKNRVCPFPLSYFCQVNAYKFKCMPRNVFTGLPLVKNSIKIRRCHQLRSYMVVASNFMKTLLLSNGFERRKIVRIPYFTYSPKENLARIKPKETYILALGRMVIQKGFEHLLRVMKIINENVSLVLVGDGPYLADLKDHAQQLGISHRVEFKGWLEHNILDDYYRKCSLVVVPSIWPEPFGIVGIEAMAHSKPVVAFNAGGISEWCQNEKNGYLINIGDENELARKINLLLENEVLLKKMGFEGQLLARKYFMPEAHMNSLLTLFDRVIQQY